jgi:hypothetical protein
MSLLASSYLIFEGSGYRGLAVFGAVSRIDDRRKQ